MAADPSKSEHPIQLKGKLLISDPSLKDGIFNRSVILLTHHTGDEGEYLCLSVTDEGTGIVEEHRQHVFEPFFTTKDVGEGTGLGLAIVYGIIAEHDGWIDVTSEVGKGSCFSVYLPKVPDAGANPDCG